MSIQPEPNFNPMQLVQPAPIGWSITSGQGPNGKLIVITLGTVTGSTVIFLDEDSTREFVKQLSAQVGGVVLPSAADLSRLVLDQK